MKGREEWLPWGKKNFRPLLSITVPCLKLATSQKVVLMAELIQYWLIDNLMVNHKSITIGLHIRPMEAEEGCFHCLPPQVLAFVVLLSLPHLKLPQAVSLTLLGLPAVVPWQAFSRLTQQSKQLPVFASPMQQAAFPKG